MVLLPAPGGACSSTLRLPASASASGGSASPIGKSRQVGTHHGALRYPRASAPGAPGDAS